MLLRETMEQPELAPYYSKDLSKNGSSGSCAQAPQQSSGRAKDLQRKSYAVLLFHERHVGWMRKAFRADFAMAFLYIYLAEALTHSITFMAGCSSSLAPLAIASASGWMHLLYFCRGHPKVGHLVEMVFRMLFNDLMRFCVVYVRAAAAAIWPSATCRCLALRCWNQSA